MFYYTTEQRHIIIISFLGGDLSVQEAMLVGSFALNGFWVFCDNIYGGYNNTHTHTRTLCCYNRCHGNAVKGILGLM
jgi:hypothetical protein